MRYSIIKILLILFILIILSPPTYSFENIETGTLGILKSFDELRNSLRIIRSNKSIDKDTEYFSFQDCETYYFDFHRFLNDFDEIKHIHYPQQNKSPINIIILESLETNFISTVSFNKNNYLSVNQKSIKKNLAEKRKQKNYFVEKPIGNANSSKKPLHDLLVSLPLSYALVKDSLKTGKENYIFKGYLDTKNSKKVNIDYFETEFNDNRYPINKRSLVNVLQKHLKNRNTEPVIISMSFALDAENLEIFESIFFESENRVRIFSNELKKQMSGLLNNVNKDKFIILIALENASNNKIYDMPRTKNNLYNLYQKFPNLILVSASKFDTDTKKFNVERKNISDLDFFTVLSPDYNIVPDEKNIGELKIEKQASTSYATPVLAAIIFNMWSLNPSLTPQEIKKVLKNTSLNKFMRNRDSIGFVVNPMEAYKNIISNLIINGYRYLYSNCQNASIHETELSHLIKCQEATAKKVNYNFFKRFYKNAEIYNSTIINQGNVIVKRRIASSFKFLNPKTISIKIKSLNFKNDRIQVSFIKTYTSSNYKDITYKVAEIGFDSKGLPFMFAEWPSMSKELIQ